MTNEIDEQKAALKQFLESLKKSVQDFGTETLGLTAEELDKVRDALISGEPLYRILGIKENVIEARYALAHQLYNSGQYENAETMFRWLTAYASDTIAHWMGLAASRQALGNYDGAIEAYQMAALYSSLEDPAPFYYSAICLLKQKKKEEAQISLNAALTLADPTKSEQKIIIDRVKALLTSLNTEGV
ncbi:MAG: SycD/LcrH family type III secretion system chaperone [Desulfovibrio sp.]|nr:SycD/LcrH family type III secretion system chaperone [Desulfovibrio sp.]